MTAPRDALLACFRAGVAAVDPGAAVRAHLLRHGRVIAARTPPPRADAAPLDGSWRWHLPDGGRVVVVAAGKAAAAMAAAAEELLGDLVAGGIAVTKHGHGLPLRRLRCLEAGHPVPDEAGLAAAREVEHAIAGLRAQDLVVCCLSGGASALLPAPPPGLSLRDLQEVTRLLLASGAPIGEINTLRRRLSRLAGGRLAQRAAPAAVLTLALSDVIGDEPAAIGSGPTVPDPSGIADVLDAIARRGLAQRLPPAIDAFLRRCERGDEPETPKPGEACFARGAHLVVGSNRHALAAAAAQARSLGAAVTLDERPLTGECADAARAFAHRARALRRGPCPAALLQGGEVTVTLGAGHGRGGRAQEFALAAGLALDGVDGVTVLAAGTDGSDGPTDAAGAHADGATMARAAAAGLDPRRHLAAHDAHPLLRATGDLVLTGPTRTNVADLYLAWIA